MLDVQGTGSIEDKSTFFIFEWQFIKKFFLSFRLKSVLFVLIKKHLFCLNHVDTCVLAMVILIIWKQIVFNLKISFLTIFLYYIRLCCSNEEVCSMQSFHWQSDPIYCMLWWNWYVILILILYCLILIMNDYHFITFIITIPFH